MGLSAGAGAVEVVGTTSDAARIFLYQPLVSVVLMFAGYWYVLGKVQKAQDARDERLLAEERLRQLQAGQMAGQAVLAGELEALEAEVEKLRMKEERESEVIGFGESSPTTRRYSYNIRVPPTEVSRRLAARSEEAKPKVRQPTVDESNAEIAVVVLGTLALTAFLLFISG